MRIWRHTHRILTLKCRDAARIYSASMDGASPPVDRIAAGMHLITCASCRRYRRQTRFLRRLFHAAADATEHDGRLSNLRLSCESRTRIEETIEEHR